MVLFKPPPVIFEDVKRKQMHWEVRTETKLTWLVNVRIRFELKFVQGSNIATSTQVTTEGCSY